jgi:hypothetical protein
MFLLLNKGKAILCRLKKTLTNNDFILLIKRRSLINNIKLITKTRVKLLLISNYK